MKMPEIQITEIQITVLNCIWMLIVSEAKKTKLECKTQQSLRTAAVGLDVLVYH
jgi:hypothetical protein